MSSTRNARIAEEIRKEISDIISNKLKDPRVSGMISITKTSLTKDMRYAKVYISVLGNDEDKNQVLAGLRNASGFIRKEIGQRIKIRYTPEIIFEIDNSIEYGMRISNILKEISKKEEIKDENIINNSE